MRADGALTAAIGAVVGSLVLAGAGLLLMLLPCDPDGLDCLGPAIIGVFAAMGGFVIGSVIGCYVALRIRKRERAGATIAVLVGLGAATGCVSAALALAGVPAGAFIPIAVAGWLGLPFLARWVVADASAKARSRRSGAPVEI